MRNFGAVSIAMITFVLLTVIFAGTTYWLFNENNNNEKMWRDEVDKNGVIEAKLQAEKLRADGLDREKLDVNNRMTQEKERADSADNQLKTSKSFNDELKREVGDLHSNHGKQLESKQKFIDEIRTERDILKGKITSLEAQFNTEKDGFIKKIEKLEEEKQAVVKANRDVMSEKNTRITQLETRVQELIGRRARQLDSVDPDGDVVTANIDKGFVGVNIGSKEGLKVGTKFEVFQIRGGGKYVAKGLIEIKEVTATVSFGHILTMASMSDPIIPGDMIGSPIFDKRERKKFFVAGDFTAYQAADVKRLINEAGGDVVEQIDLYTDYVVLGNKNIGNAKNDAIEYGVVMMNEEQLLKYLMD
ncbi:MAG: hypothetical protein ABIF71_14230 [Planctomycetota bacterium]